MEQLNEIISRNLVLLRKHNRLTQSDIASRLQYSDKTVSKWETGEITPNIENLCKLCEMYNISIDKIVKPLPTDMFQDTKKNYDNQNKIIISLLAILAVWAIATVSFVYSKLWFSSYNWLAFIWAIPCSCVVALIFNTLWGNRTLSFIITSILLWTLITAIYLQNLKYNLFAIYFIGIPLQISILLWSGLKRKNKQKE